MGLPTITRGVYWRDDFQTVAWATGSGVTATTDGDILSLSGMTSSQGYATGAALGFTPFSTSTYPFTLIRGTGPGTIDFKVFYSDSTSQTFTLNLTSTFQVFTSALTAGKTLTTFSLGNPSVAGTYQFDFTYFFKETLTLPTTSKTVRQRVKRRIVVIPIPFKEGDVLQDLGSESPEYDIAGQLVTIGPYTADQWWGIFQGLLLETGTVQADGNMTWQWFTWDQGVAKVLVANFVSDENPGRVQNWDYQLQLKEFNILGRSLSNPTGGILSTY